MSNSCYLEFINRAFEEIKVELIPMNSSDWEDDKSPNWGTTTLNDKEKYYRSESLKMKGTLISHGWFKIKICIGTNCVTLDDAFDLEDGRKEKKTRFIDVSRINEEVDCHVVITYGRHVPIVAGTTKNEKYDCYKFEFFRMSKRRFGIMNDYHYGSKGNNNGDQETVVTNIYQFIKRPEFIVMPGDLLDNPICQTGKDRAIWGNFIDPMEKRCIPIVDGFGNHDLWSSVLCTDVKNVCLKRSSKRKNNLFGYNTEGNKNENQNKDYHYSWQMELKKNGKKVLIVFFMLNNVPGIKNREDQGTNEKTQKKDTYSYDSLHFLEAAIKNVTLKGYDAVRGLVFFHINYECEKNSDSKTGETPCPERWWTYEDKKKLSEVLDQAKFPIMMSFFGHKHIPQIGKEYLYTDQKTRTKHFGLLCAYSKDVRRLNLMDISLTETNGKYEILIESQYAEVNKMTSNDACLKKGPSIDPFPIPEISV